ncbi:hypothetical protein FSPOR_4685 [Fusarium sporotrichioides]|uniref:Peptidase A1 domain-containing protein n=1 Tax=Fusarium sporotrichioides TaxID=5514 RepID=A0A395SAY6_FUSSP|nr:hypothetical protein FSPOR_4685 [Fusarium sporotrichioides]
MKGSASLLLAPSSLLGAASGLQLNKRHDPAVVSFNYEKNTRDASPSLGRRADDVAEMNVDKHGTTFLYWANFTIYTPPQNLYAEIDTGSSDLLVLTERLKPSRTFDWVESADEVSGSFGSRESWSGYYADDTFSFGNVKLDSFQFVATTVFNATTSGMFSIFGVGLPIGQRAAKKFPSLPYALRNAGESNTAACSLLLDDDQSGHFLFSRTKPTPSDTVAERLLVIMEGFGTTNDGNSTTIDFDCRPVLWIQAPLRVV